MARSTGESFISPQVQRKRIEDWANAHDVQIVQWWEEIDQSGAKRNRPMFQQALSRCEEKQAGGIVVAKLDRFARSAVDALESIKRLNDAGARLVSVEDGFDGSTPMGRFAIGILTMIAELELERIKESWTSAINEAVKRGVHVSSRPPTGYRRDEGGEKLFVEAVQVHQAALDEAREKLAQLRQQSSLASEIADGDIVQAWPTLSVQDKRRLLQGLLDRA